MEIALLGHGKMGTEIERLVRASGAHTVAIIGIKEPGGEIDTAGLQNADVVIDFTSPESEHRQRSIEKQTTHAILLSFWNFLTMNFTLLTMLTKTFITVN
ncbi:MAG: hypothetical protein AAB899_02290, partial [Patescibacteria group bacterium]